MRSLGHLLQAARRRLFLDRAGYGRPLPREVLDREYATGAWAHFHEGPELPRQILLAGLVARFHPAAAVLDIGCGSGALAAQLQPFQPRRYLGLDLSPVGLDLARKLALRGCEFVEGDFERWRPEEKFEAIVFNESVGYAQDAGALLEGFIPSLTPDGHLLVSYYRSGNWQALWRRIDRVARSVASVTLSNPLGQSWDVCVLEPKSRLPS
jgi:trans-aconitate methyltransferase